MWNLPDDGKKKAVEMIPWGLETQNRSAVAFAARVPALWQSEPGEIGTDPAGASLPAASLTAASWL